MKQMPEHTITTVHQSGVNYQDLFRFMRENWARPVLLSDERFVRWQFEMNPDDDKNESELVISSTGEILGFLGISHRSFFLDGKRRNGVELTTWIISEKLRGQGHGKKMMSRMVSLNDVAMGMGISDMALPIYLGLGFKFLRYIPRYYKVLDPQRACKYSELTPLAHKMISKDSPKELGGGVSVENLGPEDTFPEFDLFKKKFNCYSREPQYLRWRYFTHPYFKYKLFRLSKDGRGLVVVLRNDRSRHANLVHVIDMFGDPRLLPDAAVFSEGFARNLGAEVIDVYCVSPKITSAFWTAGWFSALDDAYAKVPHLFHPIEYRAPSTTSLIIHSRDNHASMFDASKLYVTKGDCDFDRPTYQTLKDMEEFND